MVVSQYRIELQVQIVDEQVKFLNVRILIKIMDTLTLQKGLVLGVYSEDGKDGKSDVTKLTSFGEKINKSTAGKLLQQINM